MKTNLNNEDIKIAKELGLNPKIDDEEIWLLFIREVGRDDESLIRSLLEKKEVLKMTYEAYDKLNKDELILKNCKITLEQLNELRLSDRKN